MANVEGHLDFVQQHIGQAQKVRKGLFFDAANRVLQPFQIVGALGGLLEVFNRAGQKPAGAARRVKNDFAQFWVGHFDHKLRHRSRRVIFAGISGVLQVAQNLLVNIAKKMLVARRIEVERADFVDDLAQQRARLHVVVSVAEHLAHDVAARDLGRGFEIFESLENGAVDEAEQGVAGHAFGVGGPVAPAQLFGNRRSVILAEKLHLLFLVIENLEEKEPGELGNALGVAVHSGVLAHDVLNGFDGRGK